jgi:hypothetical protein
MSDPPVGMVAKVRILPTQSNCEYYHNISNHNESGRRLYTSEISSTATKVNNKGGRTKSSRQKKLKVSNFSETELEFPRMQTMDRRVSSSSDQIDNLRKPKIRAKPLRTHSSSRLDYERKTEVNDVSEGGDFVTAKIHRKCDLRSSSFHQTIQRTGGDWTKTPFALFLEDDGPYSRKLYGPLVRDREKPCRGRQKEMAWYRGESEKDKVRNISIININNRNRNINYIFPE